MKRFRSLILISLIVFLLYWRYQVGIIRAFDADEFTHLHWAANVARGQRPYIDFFTFFTPGFYWVLAPLFWLVKTPDVFVAARLIAYGIFLEILTATGVLYASLRRTRWALVPVILLAFLPMPYDKYLELRPDNLATLLAMMGVIAEIWAIREKRPVQRWWFISGLSYGLSLVVLVKTLPFVVMGMLVAIWDSGVIARGVTRLRQGFGGQGGVIQAIREIWEKKEHVWFIVGLAAPLAVMFLYFLTLGDLGKVFYSLGKMAFEANTLGRVYIMESHLFFFPNPAFYGGRWGITAPFLVNHLIWVVGLLVGCVRFLTPFLTGDGDKRQVKIEVLVSGIFILSVIGYVNFFPLKHSQYLIPIAVFIVIYASDMLVGLFAWIKRRMGEIGFIGVIGIIGVIIVMQTIEVNQPKLGFPNGGQLIESQKLHAMLPKDVEVVDLEGRLLFWQDAYDICCLPFGQFTRYLSRPPKPLRDVLEAKKVPYIFQGNTGRMGYLSHEDQWYIRTYYEPVSGWGESLWKRKQ